MLIGYARVSTNDQDTAAQGVALKAAGWELDRLARSLRDVLTIMERLGEAGAGFRRLTEAIDTTTPAGRMMMQMVGAFAEFEKSMLKERTKAGLDAARQKRPDWRSASKADASAAGRDPKVGVQRQKNRR